VVWPEEALSTQERNNKAQEEGGAANIRAINKKQNKKNPRKNAQTRHEKKKISNQPKSQICSCSSTLIQDVRLNSIPNPNPNHLLILGDQKLFDWLGKQPVALVVAPVSRMKNVLLEVEVMSK
jgi:hypothetical protein